MSTSTIAAHQVARHCAVQFLSDILKDYSPQDLAVRLWDGTQWNFTCATRCTIVLRHPASLRRMFLPPKMLTACEAYLYGDIDVEGDVEAYWGLLEYLFVKGLPAGRLERKRIHSELADLPEQGPKRGERQAPRMTGEFASLSRDRQAIRAHYDVSNEFYQLWLDQRMIYSCAYFTHPGQSIDQAQEQKLDYICRKLRLKPGERLLDIGCGWGGLIRFAAEHYGVTALGVTISAAQAQWAREHIHQAGLASRCHVELCDYRQLQDREGFDKIVSVGMFEHVTEAMLSTYFEQAWNLLKPGGVFLNHAISKHVGPVLPVGTPFVYLYIFPDSELQPINATLRVAETTGFEVRDVECLREHYELTTRQWLRRLEAKQQEARAITSDLTYRIYRLYLAMSARAFRIGQPTIYQTLLSKPHEGRSGLPLTRTDWYASPPGQFRDEAA